MNILKVLSWVWLVFLAGFLGIHLTIGFIELFRGSEVFREFTYVIVGAGLTFAAFSVILRRPNEQ